MTDEESIHNYQEISSEKEKRQTLMETTLKLATVLAALGISGSAWGDIANAEPVTSYQESATIAQSPSRQIQVTPQQRSTRNLLQEAIETGDMEGAIKKWGGRSKLTSAQSSALRNLTPKDLAKLKVIKGQLGSGVAAEAEGYVVF